MAKGAEGLRSLLYAGGPSSERDGVGEALGIGLREPNLLDTRLVDLVVPGAGDVDWSLLRGLRVGSFDGVFRAAALR